MTASSIVVGEVGEDFRAKDHCREWTSRRYSRCGPGVSGAGGHSQMFHRLSPRCYAALHTTLINAMCYRSSRYVQVVAVTDCQVICNNLGYLSCLIARCLSTWNRSRRRWVLGTRKSYVITSRNPSDSHSLSRFLLLPLALRDALTSSLNNRDVTSVVCFVRPRHPMCH